MRDGPLFVERVDLKAAAGVLAERAGLNWEMLSNDECADAMYEVLAILDGALVGVQEAKVEEVETLHPLAGSGYREFEDVVWHRQRYVTDWKGTE